jgi:hypothetical protein
MSDDMNKVHAFNPHTQTHMSVTCSDEGEKESPIIYINVNPLPLKSSE